MLHEIGRPLFYLAVRLILESVRWTPFSGDLVHQNYIFHGSFTDSTVKVLHIVYQMYLARVTTNWKSTCYSAHVVLAKSCTRFLLFILRFPFLGAVAVSLHNTAGQLEAQNASAHWLDEGILLWPRYFKILKQAHTAVSAGIHSSIKVESSLGMGTNFSGLGTRRKVR